MAKFNNHNFPGKRYNELNKYLFVPHWKLGIHATSVIEIGADTFHYVAALVILVANNHYSYVGTMF
jgi:hypothetical protein